MDRFPLSLDQAVELARKIVLERFAHPRAAWLGGSVVRGEATSTSDLDISVLVDGPPAPMRDSFVCQGIPVELFIHSEDTMAQSRAKDRERRQPSQQRLIAETVVLIDNDGSGQRLRADCQREIVDGPARLPRSEIDRMRYGLTDLLDDFRGLAGSDGLTPDLTAAYFPVHLFERSAQLLLAEAGAWQGSGKGLIAALRDWARHTDSAQSGGGWTSWLDEWAAELTQGTRGDRGRVIRLVTEALDHCGGPLWAGYRVGGEAPQEADRRR